MPTIPEKCPDTGACHHDCEDTSCFRVVFCSPLSISGWDDWPKHIKRKHPASGLKPSVEAVIVSG